MQELRIGTGLTTYRINDTCEVSVNPTDVFFIEGLYNIFDALDKRQETYQQQIDKGDHKVVFQAARAANDEIRSDINSLFGFDICKEVFGNLNVCALSDGMPLWANLLLAFVDLAGDSVEAQQKQRSARMEKYTSKYHR